MSDKHALAKVEVNNSINLTLNQNDLIDLAISEQVEKLEAEIEAADKELEEIKKNTEEIKANFLSVVLSTAKSDTYQDTVKVAQILKIDIDKCIRAQWNYNNTPDMLIGTFKSVPDISSNTADKINSFKRNSREQNFYKYNITGVRIDVDTTSKSDVRIDMNDTLELSKSDKAKLNKELEPFNKKWYQLLLRIYDLNLELINYKYGEKKIKAKVVRAALSKSKEGQEILQMLEKAANVKLLM